MQLSVKVDTTEVERMLTELQREFIPKATSAALNRVGVSARAEAVREVAKATSMRQRDVRERTAFRKASRQSLVVELKAEPWSPNLIRYQARQTKQGVSAKAWGQRKVYRGAFIGNKCRTVFTREGKDRLPLKALHGPSVPKEFMREHTTKAMERVVRERFPIEFQRTLGQFRRQR